MTGSRNSSAARLAGEATGFCLLLPWRARALLSLHTGLASGWDSNPSGEVGQESHSHAAAQCLEGEGHRREWRHGAEPRRMLPPPSRAVSARGRTARKTLVSLPVRLRELVERSSPPLPGSRSRHRDRSPRQAHRLQGRRGTRKPLLRWHGAHFPPFPLGDDTCSLLEKSHP